jgi:hypothetical protein
MHSALPLLESSDIGERRLRDALQRFLGKEALMPGDDDIWKCKQTSENVIDERKRHHG